MQTNIRSMMWRIAVGASGTLSQGQPLRSTTLTQTPPTTIIRPTTEEGEEKFKIMGRMQCTGEGTPLLKQMH